MMISGLSASLSASRTRMIRVTVVGREQLSVEQCQSLTVAEGIAESGGEQPRWQKAFRVSRENKVLVCR
jgi:hypothetical protein